MLRTEHRGTIIDAKLIEEEVVCFYKGLLGTGSHSIQAVDRGIVRRGPLLGRLQADTLLIPISNNEIDQGL